MQVSCKVLLHGDPKVKQRNLIVILILTLEKPERERKCVVDLNMQKFDINEILERMSA